MRIIHRIIAVCVAGLLVAAAARAADWTEDYPAALAKAKKEHKLLLLDFTGSDWCPWCKRIEAEVFSTNKFGDFASQKLVLVKLDFPRQRELAKEVVDQNAALQKKFKVEGFPTIVVIDPSEKVVFVQEGYKEGGPEAFLAQFPKPAG
jgi:thioredoxin-related protein